MSALVARHRDYSALLLDDHRTDRLWHPLVDVLDCYGPAHQFSVVDRLAEVDDYWEAPLDSWNRFEFAILSHRPTLAEILTSPLEGLTGRREISDEAARALLRWWNLIHQFCAEGCFGERGTTLSAQLAPPGPESELTGAPVVSPFAS
ncbi:hypothetical protein KIV56_05915 [Cryobacterium breve]|uniref:Uncharacterized protein n=1 Tax=Cryobacterium breve TaxID=1259258 RepID=A0ABY7NH02_9MICO|nr:hypothetical protein [Cryobacterium breve]WBM80855.1 hypothetical protein KIV56_05915 [Cryobacterium breve]